MKTLKDWMPDKADITPKIEKLLDAQVINEYSSDDPENHPKAGKFKNIHNWCIVKNNERLYAVGWNESPRNGWSFPVKWLKEESK